ncbi:unnamed protein product [Sphagnum tenellum]
MAAGANSLVQQSWFLRGGRTAGDSGGGGGGGATSDHGGNAKKSGFLHPPATCTAAKCTRLVVNRRAEGRRSGRSTPHRVLLRAICMRREEVAMVDCNSSVMEIDLQLEEGGRNGHAPAPTPASAVLRPPRAAEPEMINEYIGFGMLQENGSLYRERFVVRFSEVGPRRTTSLETLTCLLQEAACNHVTTIGYGAFHGTNDERLITVTTRMHIEVDRYPTWRSLLEIDTWFCTEGRNAVRRDWTVKEVRTGEIIACATSTWVLMHLDTKTMHRITDKIRAELAPWVRDPPKWALSEERRRASSGRIARLHGSPPYEKSSLEPLDRDFDMNQHVNNIKYITWTLESIPNELKEDYEVSMITLEYRREASKGDKVDSLARREPCDVNNDVSALEGLSQPQFIHLIRNHEGDEINRGRTVWRHVKHAAEHQGEISP